MRIIDSNDANDVQVCQHCGTEIVLSKDESAALAAAVRNGESEANIKCKGCGATITLAELDSTKRDADKQIEDLRDSLPKEFRIDFKF